MYIAARIHLYDVYDFRVQVMCGMNPELQQELKMALEKEHASLVAQLKSIAKPDPHMPGDWDAIHPQFEPEESGSHAALEEEADEVEEYEVRLEAEHSLESRLLAVTHALQRIQNNTYGICKRCRKEIRTERLKANPAAENCINHS